MKLTGIILSFWSSLVSRGLAKYTHLAVVISGTISSNSDSCTNGHSIPNHFPINILLKRTAASKQKSLSFAENSANTPIILEHVLLEAPELVRTLISATAPVVTSEQHSSLQYSIFVGTSALRSLPEDDRIMVHACKSLKNKNLAGAVLLLLRGYADAAHEVILGVDTESVAEAEYAATHPGQTTWTEDHPLNDAADMLHSLLHRLEGGNIGEGGHTGFANSMYWAAGGLKKLPQPIDHPIRAALVTLALKYTPLCVEEGVVSKCGTSDEIVSYKILADRNREVTIHGSGQWDCFRFIELCQDFNEERIDRNNALHEEVVFLQRMEILLLLQWGIMGEILVR